MGLLEIVIVLAQVYAVVWFVRRLKRKQAEKVDRRVVREQLAIEQQRVEECHEVVRYFANSYGYLARTVVSREELEDCISEGATGQELSALITNRMLATDGIQLGEHGNGLPVVLPDEYRDKHIYVIGKSGYGKTTFLRFLILQDFHRGNGVGVLAPELEMLTEELLPFIPDDRIADVIYFNPADLAFPVVLNPLHMEPDEDIDLHVDETFTILQRVVGEGGPRMDEILRHSLYALTERAGSTLLDFEPLLDRQDDTLRKEVVKNTQDDQTKRFFTQTYPQLPKDAHFPIVNRIGRIVRSKYVRNCLCPPTHSTLTASERTKRLLNIRHAMDSGKILLFNLSDGLLGEAASQLIGQLIVAKFQTATMSRADTAKTTRKPFYLYLDEFQNFCGAAQQSYEKILSRARKYRLGLILAHQQTRQVPLDLYREILGNVTTLVSFQVAQADAGRLAPEFIGQFDLAIDALPPEELLQLGVGETYCRIGKSTFPMWIPKINVVPDYDRAQKVIECSRKTYGIPRTQQPSQQGATGESAIDDSLDDLDPNEVF